MEGPVVVQITALEETTRHDREAGYADGDRHQAGFLRPLVQALVQEALEAEMTAALGTAKGGRTLARQGYRSGYDDRGLVTRVGKLRGPQDRAGRFSTALFER